MLATEEMRGRNTSVPELCWCSGFPPDDVDSTRTRRSQCAYERRSQREGLSMFNATLLREDREQEMAG